jgi:hypothetical protein
MMTEEQDERLSNAKLETLACPHCEREVTFVHTGELWGGFGRTTYHGEHFRYYRTEDGQIHMEVLPNKLAEYARQLEADRTGIDPDIVSQIFPA